MTPAPFALLDAAGSASRLYTGFVREHRIAPAALEAQWPAVEADLAAGHHAVLLADYEWGARLIGAGDAALHEDAAGALRVLMFDSLQVLDEAGVQDWLAAHDGPEPGPAGTMNLRASVSRSEFDTAIQRIHDWIAAGETYQLNYTYRIVGRAFGAPIALYRRLRQRQPVAYGALVRLPAGGATEWVLSCSPELFVEQHGGELRTRPMKGTAPRSANPAQDAANARWLAADPKNRAENLMIVDLLRNDLGRVAQTGSVAVPQRFVVETYRTVHQMTSTVTARLAPGVKLPAILRALFPCGSITGAPKHHTMELIAQIETTPRGLYCGAIGWIAAAPAGAACGDFCLSVAIRTLTLGAETRGTRPVALGVGGGIVIDSEPESEWQETRTKARFVTQLDPGFTLFETLRVERGAALHPAAHLDRLAGSATDLGFEFDRAAASAAIDAAARELPAAPHRLRLDLAADGTLRVVSAPLPALPAGPVELLLANAPLPEAEAALSAHKTSLRARYDAGIRAAEAAGAFDTLFFNAQGELTEGGRCNVFVKLAGAWFTPPLTAGLLPGTARARLITELHASERRISRVELCAAEAIVVCNALRGALQARIASAL